MAATDVGPMERSTESAAAAAGWGISAERRAQMDQLQSVLGKLSENGDFTLSVSELASSLDCSPEQVTALAQLFPPALALTPDRSSIACTDSMRTRLLSFHNPTPSN
jgi:transcriptional regulator GlxA family with amidase domain